jgi:NhaA family Na+:H+ antiporter
MPLFALANTGLVFGGDWVGGLFSANGLGIMTGLLVGKPLGIVLFCLLAIGIGWGQLPSGTSWRQLIGAGFLGGIGFTMSIFITLLAFNDPQIVQEAKIAVLFGSLLAGSAGFLILRRGGPAMS